LLKTLRKRHGKDVATRQYIHTLFPYGFGQRACCLYTVFITTELIYINTGLTPLYEYRPFLGHLLLPPPRTAFSAAGNCCVPAFVKEPGNKAQDVG
jgi:hypothetical protein